MTSRCAIGAPSNVYLVEEIARQHNIPIIILWRSSQGSVPQKIFFPFFPNWFPPVFFFSLYFSHIAAPNKHVPCCFINIQWLTQSAGINWNFAAASATEYYPNHSITFYKVNNKNIDRLIRSSTPWRNLIIRKNTKQRNITQKQQIGWRRYQMFLSSKIEINKNTSNIQFALFPFEHQK